MRYRANLIGTLGLLPGRTGRGVGLVRRRRPVCRQPGPCDGRDRRRDRTAVWPSGAGVFLFLLLIGFGVAWHDQANGIFRPTVERAALIAATVLGIMGTPALLFVGWIPRMNVRR
ncbi:MAG: hypothetical protein IT532_05160 [Burkholderiales bacterium]|nr:hypothetical protein [Burkholderiales bacterium]